MRYIAALDAGCDRGMTRAETLWCGGRERRSRKMGRMQVGGCRFARYRFQDGRWVIFWGDLVSLGCFSYFFEKKRVFLANAANAANAVIVGFCFYGIIPLVV